MGYALPAAIGASLWNNKGVVCITGDGSIQMNIQELQTIKHHRLPIKIFVLNNKGYRSIEQTQTSYFESDFIGCNKDSGISFPDLRKIANAYNILYTKISKTEDIDRTLKHIFDVTSPVICEIILDNEYVFSPKLSAEKLSDGTIIAKSLEDLSPLLEREEFYSNMIIKNKDS